MLEVKLILEERGLKTVIIQTEAWTIGPGNRRARTLLLISLGCS
jgi:hypothetical protein